MQIVTSVRAYQWPYTLYVFREAAERNSAERLYEATNRQNNIWLLPFMELDVKNVCTALFVYMLINTFKDYNYFIIKVFFVFAPFGLVFSYCGGNMLFLTYC